MKSGLLLPLLVITFIISSCKDEDAPPTPVANFDFAACEAPCYVTFVNTSQNATTYFWNFGDGTTSTEKTPVKYYQVSGTYNVKLDVTGEGGSHSREKQVVITAPLIYYKYKVDGILIEAETIIATRNIPTGFMDLRCYRIANSEPFFQLKIAEPVAGFLNGMNISLNQSSSTNGSVAIYRYGEEYTTANDSTGLTLNISEIDYSQGGIVSATFSGVVKNSWGGTALITEGTLRVSFSN